MKELTSKMAQFFSGEDFAEHGDDARLELTPAELRQISNLMTENARLKTELDKYKKSDDNAIDGKIVTGLKMSDGEPVRGFVIGTTPFTYVLPEDEVYKACNGEQQAAITLTAERILAHN